MSGILDAINGKKLMIAAIGYAVLSGLAAYGIAIPEVAWKVLEGFAGIAAVSRISKFTPK